MKRGASKGNKQVLPLLLILGVLIVPEEEKEVFTGVDGFCRIAVWGLE